jgi:hypothetical protein
MRVARWVVAAVAVVSCLASRPYLGRAAAMQHRVDALATTAAPNLASIVSVLDFGAVGDGQTDNTAAFTAAINSLNTTTNPGGIVFVPAGQYVFDGSITLNTATSLVGTYQSVPVREAWRATGLAAGFALPLVHMHGLPFPSRCSRTRWRSTARCPTTAPS